MPHLLSNLLGWAKGLTLDRFVLALLLVAMVSFAGCCRRPTPTPPPTPTPTPSSSGQRVPVLFVHGHSHDSNETWVQPANGTSFSAALAANPQLPIDPFYLALPVHSNGQNQDRSITDDATDILAMIEGGVDSQGSTQVGILNMPAYQAAGRVAIIANSQGTLSSRYYIKNLMGSRRNPVGTITVSEFVTLAAPNHGVGDLLLSCGDLNEPDRARRELCAGRIGTARDCPPCQGLLRPAVFTSNDGGEETFISDLNGHPLSDSCNVANSSAAEAPKSRPGRPDGILYLNLYGAGDLIVGSDGQNKDCLGRRQPRNLAPDADNREFNGVPILIHANVPHHWEIICTALKTVTDHQAPAAASPCAGLTHP